MKGEGDRVAKFYELVGRALLDPDFRKRLKDSEPSYRSSALREMGFEGNEAEMGALEQALASIDKLERQFVSDSDIRAAT